MKRLLKTVALLLTLAALLSIFAGCFSSTVKASVVYDKKYQERLDGDNHRYFVFHSDHTGYYDVYFVSTNETGVILSGRIDFTWRAADDGTVYLFNLQATYNDDHTEGRGLTDFSTAMPLTFGDGFLIALSVSTYGTSIRRYVLEGSDLEKALNED